jgi:hypothetical protein
MTTSPVVTVTDELIEQLNALTCLNESGAVMIHVNQVRALMVERAELKRDAERFRHLMFNHVQWAKDDKAKLIFGPYPAQKLRVSIDAAMQSES